MGKRIEAQVSNGASSGCFRVPKHISEYIQSEYFSVNGQFSVDTLIGLALSSNGETPSLVENPDSPYYMQGISEAIEGMEESLRNGQQLSSEDKILLGEFAKVLRQIRKDSHKQDQEDKKKADQGKSTLTAAQCFKTIKENLPIGDREEILDQIFSRFQLELDRWQDSNPDLSRTEVFEKYQSTIFQNLRAFILEKTANGKARAEAGKTLNGFKSYPIEFFDVVENLCSNDRIWASAVFIMQQRFFLAEKIKVGEAEGLSYSNDEENNEMSDREVETAEETGKEHWQVKVDSQSAFGSMSREVRSVLYRAVDTSSRLKGFLGVFPTADVMELHDALMEARSEGLFSNSQDFIKSLPAGIQALLNAAIKKDPTLQTAIFRVYNKGTQEYGFYSYSKGDAWYNASYKVAFSYYQEWQSNYSQLPANADDVQRAALIFDFDGNIKERRAKEFNSWIQKCKYERTATGYVFTNRNLNEQHENYDCSAETKDKRSPGRRFVIQHISDSLGLKLTAQDQERLAHNDSAFIAFLANAKKAAQEFTQNKTLELVMDSVKSNIFQIYRSSKPLGTIAKRDIVKKKKTGKRKLAFEKGFRYNKSTYFAHVVKNYIMDLFEDIRKGIKKTNKLRFLIDNPVMEHNFIAEKIIKGENASTEEKEIIEVMASSLTRLLGNKQTPFDHFTEADNLKMLLADNITHYKMASSKKRFIRVPLFVTGDSNANRVFLLPMLQQKEIDTNLIEVLQSEILRMEQFKALLATMEAKAKISGTDAERSLAYGNIRDNAERFTFLDVLNDPDLTVAVPRQQQGGTVMVTVSLKDTLIDALYPTDPDTTAGMSIEVLSGIRDKKEAMRGMSVAQILYTYYVENPETFSQKMKEGAIKNLFVGENGVLTWSFNQGFQNFYQKLIDCGVLRINEKKEVIPSLSDLTKVTSTHQEETGEDFLHSLYFNLRFYNIQQLQFLTSDIGFYDNTENLQKRFKQMIASGDPIDITARFPDGTYIWQDPEKIKEGEIKENITQNVIYVREQKASIKEFFGITDDGANSPFRKLWDVKGDGKKETKASLTDGQAWRTFTSYRRILGGLSKWTDAHEQVYKIIMNHREQHRESYERGEIVPLSTDEVKAILATGVIFQPLKPYYFGFEMIEYNGADGKPHNAAIPVQHKYSEFPLIPELLPVKNSAGDNAPINKLVAMGMAMEQQGIDLACDSSCVKVGCFGEVVIDDCTDVQSFKKAFKPDVEIDEIDPETNEKKKVESNELIHSLPLHNWREQSNQPAHNDVVRALGSQLTYHAYANIENLPSDKEVAEGQRTEVHYSSIESQFPIKNGKRVIKLTKDVEIDITKGFTKETVVKLLNFLLGSGYVKSAVKLINDFSTIQKVGQQLSGIALRDDRTGYDRVLSYDINEDGDLLVPANEATNAFDNCAALAAQIRKKIVKRGMKGGSAIQVSPYGYDDVLQVQVDEENNMIVSDCAMVFDITVKGPDGKPVELNYTDYVDPETGMMLGYEVDTETGELGTTLKAVEPADPVKDKDGNLVKGKDFYGWNTKLGQDYGDILSLIAYRIPTEKEYSILKLKVKRFFMKTTGGIIMVPKIFTQVAGFDFDIDKLFFIRKDFGFNIKKEVTNKDIWEGIYQWLQNTPALKPLYDRMEALKEQAIRMQIQDAVREASVALDNEIQEITDSLRKLTAYPKDILEAGNITTLFSRLEKREKVVPYVDKDGATREMKITEYALPGRVNGMETNLEKRREYIQKVKESLEERLKQLLKEKREIYAAIEETAYRGEKTREYYEMARQQLLESPSTKQEVVRALQQLPDNASAFFMYFVKQNLAQYGEKKIQLDPERPLFDQSQAVINNLFFQVLSERLSSPDTLNERTTPGGPWMHKKAKPLMLAIRYGLSKLKRSDLYGKLRGGSAKQALKQYSEEFENYSPKYDATDPLTIVHYHTYNALYDRLIGIAANQNINQRLTAICKEYILTEGSLSFGSMLDSSSSDMGRNIQATMIDGRDTELIVTEFLSGAVDAVKDALLEFFGISDDNFNIVCCLAKLGASAEDLGLLFNQPVVMDAIAIMAKNGHIGFTTALTEALKNLQAQYSYQGAIAEKEESNRQEKIKYDATHVTTERLCRSLICKEAINQESRMDEETLNRDNNKITSAEKEEFFETQMAVVHLLKAAQVPATELSEQINTTKTTSVKIVGSTPGSILALIDRELSFAIKAIKSAFTINTSTTEKTREAPIDPNASVSDRESGRKILEDNLDNAFGLPAIAYASIKGAWDHIICRLFPFGRSGYKRLISSIKGLTSKDYLPDAAYDDILKDGTLYFVEQLFPIFKEKDNVEYLDAAGEKKKSNLKSRDFYVNYFPKYFESIRLFYKNKEDSEFNSIPLLQCIRLDSGKGKRIERLVFDGIGSSEKLQKDIITESWDKMIHSEDPIIRALAHHLIQYSYYMAGFDYGPGSFLSTLSTEAKTTYTGNDDFTIQEGEITYANMFNALFAINVGYSALTGNTFFQIKNPDGTVNTASVKLWMKLFLKHNALKYYQFCTTISSGGDVYKGLKISPDHSVVTVDLSDPKGVLNSYRELFVIRTEYRDEESLAPTDIWFKPCIVIGDNLYICDNMMSGSLESGSIEFNKCRNASAPVMDYYLVQRGSKVAKNYKELTPTTVLDPATQVLMQDMREFVSLGEIAASQQIQDTEEKTVLTVQIAWERLTISTRKLLDYINATWGAQSTTGISLPKNITGIRDRLSVFLSGCQHNLEVQNYQEVYNACTATPELQQLRMDLQAIPATAGDPNYNQLALSFIDCIQTLSRIIGKEHLGIDAPLDIKATMGLKSKPQQKGTTGGTASGPAGRTAPSTPSTKERIVLLSSLPVDDIFPGMKIQYQGSEWKINRVTMGSWNTIYSIEISKGSEVKEIQWKGNLQSHKEVKAILPEVTLDDIQVGDTIKYKGEEYAVKEKSGTTITIEGSDSFDLMGTTEIRIKNSSEAYDVEVVKKENPNDQASEFKQGDSIESSKFGRGKVEKIVQGVMVIKFEGKKETVSVKINRASEAGIKRANIQAEAQQAEQNQNICSDPS